MGRQAVWRWGTALAVVLSATACQEAGAPERSSGSLHLTLRVAYILSGQTLDVAPYYRRADQTIVPLEPQQIPLEDSGTQSVSVTIDITKCLTDDAREQIGTGCPLRVTIVLRNELQEVLDSQQVGPIDATPGASVSAPEVTLRQVETVTLSASADSVLVGGSLTVSAAVRDRVGAPLTDRTLSWTSSNPAVATVSSSGVVSGITPGAVTITASLQGRPTGPAGAIALASRGGIALIGAAGGTVYSRDGELTLGIPPGALPAPTTITIQPAQLDAAPTRLVNGTAFDLKPDGLAFQQPVTLTIRYAASAIPGGLSTEPSLRLFTVDSMPVRLAGSTVNPSAHSASATITHFSGYLVALAMVGVRSLALGDDHVCAALNTGVAICLGGNNAGGLGDGTTDSGDENFVVGGHNFVSVTAGNAFSCGVTTGGEVYCWGLNSRGQLGIGTTTNALTPQLVPLPVQAVSVTAGFDSACAVDQNRLLYCWGNNFRGQLGAPSLDTCGTSPCSLTPIPIAPAAPSGTRAITSGLQHRCELSSLQVACWGSNTSGQLGLPVNNPAQSQQPVPQLTGVTAPFTALLGGNVMTCGLQGNGAAYCWGGDNFGSRGSGSTSVAASPTPVAIAGGLQFASLGPGRANFGLAPSCGVTLAGDGYCWGANFHGALGTTASLGSCSTPVGQLPCTGTPVPLAGGLKFKEIYPGMTNVCGRTTSDEVFCWGLRQSGGGDALTPERLP